jgi:hypothetical protein
MDLNAFTETLRRGFSEIPPIAIALVLLAGPTAALIGYRLVRVARRMRTAPETEAAPLWVCHDCRSVNELRVSHCYRCGVERDATDEIEIVVDQPAARPGWFEVPAGSPFAAVATGGQPRPGVAVMTGPTAADERVAVGPGHDQAVLPSGREEEAVRRVEGDR